MVCNKLTDFRQPDLTSPDTTINNIYNIKNNFFNSTLLYYNFILPNFILLICYYA